MKKALFTLLVLTTIIISGCSTNYISKQLSNNYKTTKYDDTYKSVKPIKEKPISLTEEIDNLTLSLRLDKNIYSQTDTIVVTASLINNSETTYQYKTGSTCSFVPGIHFGSAIFRYYKEPEGLYGPCGSSITHWEINPGKRSTRKFVLEPKKYVKEKAFYKGDVLSITASYKGIELKQNVTFKDIPSFNYSAPFPRTAEEAKEYASTLNITKNGLENMVIRKTTYV